MGDIQVNKAIRIASYNCRGLRNPAVISLLDHYDLILLQETLLTKQDIVALNSLSRDVQGAGVSSTDASKGIIIGRPSGGIGFLWRKTIGHLITELDYDFDWLSGVSLTLPNGLKYFIFNTYMPLQ